LPGQVERALDGALDGIEALFGLSLHIAERLLVSPLRVSGGPPRIPRGVPLRRLPVFVPFLRVLDHRLGDDATSSSLILPIPRATLDEASLRRKFAIRPH